jgi:hypothetical protein
LEICLCNAGKRRAKQIKTGRKQHSSLAL